MSTGVFRQRFFRPPPYQNPALGAFAQGKNVAVSPAALTLAATGPSSADMVLSVAVSPAALSLTSQNVDLLGPLAAANAVLTGQSIDARLDISVLPTSATLILSAKDIVASLAAGVTPRAMTFTAYAITAPFLAGVSVGSLTFSGQSITAAKTNFIVPTPNSIAFSGVQIGVHFGTESSSRAGLHLPGSRSRPTYWRGMGARSARLR